MTSRPNRVLAIVIGGIALLAIAAAILSATRPVADYGPGTPEGVVQSYLSAVLDGDHQAAAALLVQGSPCTVDDVDRAYTPEGVRVVLLDTAVDGDTAQVKVDVVTSSGGPLDGPEYSEEHTFRLARSANGWRIAGEPWPMFECSKGA